MTEIPAHIVTAAAEAMRAELVKHPMDAPYARIFAPTIEQVAEIGLRAAAPLISEQIAAAIKREHDPCPDHPIPWLPRPSCWTCGRNGMVYRLARIARQTFPKETDRG